MSLPAVIDIAIGLVFIFLILSLLASEIQELLTTLLQWRARHLRDAIEVLLAGGVETQQQEKVRQLVDNLYDDPLIRNINQEAKGLAGKARGMTRLLIPGNRRGSFGIDQTTGPSYIAPETFATSLLERVGLESLSRKLVEVRLEKFATRIVGIYDGGQRMNMPVAIPPETDRRIAEQLWNRGRVRLIAEKVGLTADGKLSDLSTDPNFQTLVEEFDDILHDFKTQESNLVTSIERMEESFRNYIGGYKTVEILDRDSNQSTSPDETILNRFSERLEAFRQGVFGQKSERAIISGGLRPSLLEIAELLDQTSTTYKEVDQSYRILLDEGKALDQDMVPLLAEKLLEKHIEVAQQQLVQQYPEDLREYFKRNYPAVYWRVAGCTQSGRYQSAH